MRNGALKFDNLVKLLEGLSLLDNRDHELLISVVNTLDFAKNKGEKAILANTPPCKTKNITRNC